MYIDILRQYININDLTQKCANNVLIFCANLASPRHSPSAGQLLALSALQNNIDCKIQNTISIYCRFALQNNIDCNNIQYQ